MYDAGKEDYLRPSEHIGLDWIGLGNISSLAKAIKLDIFKWQQNIISSNNVF